MAPMVNDMMHFREGLYYSPSLRYKNGILFYNDFVEKRFIVDEFAINCNRSTWYEHFCIIHGYENVNREEFFL